MDDYFKLILLLNCLRITCRYYQGDEEECGLSENYPNEDGAFFECHMTCNCDGDIVKCDLPEKFRACL